MLRVEGLIDWQLQAAVIDRCSGCRRPCFAQYTVGDFVDRSMGIDAARRHFHRPGFARDDGRRVRLVQLSA